MEIVNFGVSDTVAFKTIFPILFYTVLIKLCIVAAFLS